MTVGSAESHEESLPLGDNDVMKTDVIVVGAGIIGLASAFLAHRHGLTVRVIDRSERPVGSSIQNFGHACFTGQPDEFQDIVWASREGWLKAAEATGLWASESGTYLPAQSDTEMQVLEEFAQHRGSEQVQLVDAPAIAKGIGNPEVQSFGGAYLPLDMRVNPREAAPRIAQWLGENGVNFEWHHEVKEVVDGTVKTNRGEFVAERVICCPNFFMTQLFPDIADKYELRVCTLMMAMLERPKRIPENLAMLTGTALTRYDGFAAMPSIPKFKGELAQREPELVDCIANLMATGIPEGLLVGDSHNYDLSPEPFMDETVGQLLIEKTSALVGIERPRVLQRWQGRYADSPLANLILERPDEQTCVLAATSGIGMTMSFGLANVALLGEELPV